MPPLLQVENLNVTFSTQTGEVAAVRDVSFSIPESGTLGLVGESGSGKSATSLAIMRLLPPQAGTRGKILFSGEDLLSLPEEAMRRMRGARIAMIFQEPMTALNPVMRVGDQVAEAVLAHHRVSKAEAGQRAVEALWSDPVAWWRASVLTTARMAWFSSDRTIREYAEEIWHVPAGID